MIFPAEKLHFFALSLDDTGHGQCSQPKFSQDFDESEFLYTQTAARIVIRVVNVRFSAMRLP
jgi:hypothetical protein